MASENRRHRGRARKLSGHNLKDVINRLQRTAVDVNVSFRCRVRGYAGGPAKFVDKEFRAVAIRRPDGEYAVYATNAPGHMLPAEEAWKVYRLRWEVETFFKTAKSGCALADLPSGDRHRVEALVYAALIRATLAMKAKANLVRLTPARHRIRLNPQQWMRWWNRHLHQLLRRLIVLEVPLDLLELFRMLSDPNRTRTPSRVAFGRPA